jgi:hypothetical protein
MKRDLIVCILLVIAGIVLAIVIFGAGAVWKGRTPARAPGASLQNRMQIWASARQGNPASPFVLITND